MSIEFLSYLFMIPAGLICIYPMVHQLKYKLKWFLLSMFVLFTVMAATASGLYYRFGFSPNLMFFLIACIFFFIYHHGLTVHISKSLSVYLWVCALMAVISNYANGFDALRNPANGADNITLDFILFQLGLSVIFAVITYYPVSHYGSILIDRLNIPRIWFMYIPFWLIIILTNVLIRPLYYETLYTNFIFKSFWIIVSATLLLWVMLSIIFYITVTGILRAAETEEQKRMLEMQEGQYASQMKYVEESVRARHDFKQLVRTLGILIETGDYQKAEEIIRDYTENLPDSEIKRYCAHSALNALLNYYAQLYLQNSVKFDYRIGLPEELRINDADFCGMVGNILENILTACQQIPEQERWMQLTIVTKNDRQLYVVATNSFSGKVRIRDGQYLSTNRTGNGIGLRSITSTAERYSGLAHYSHQGKEFYTDIAIPLKETLINGQILNNP